MWAQLVADELKDQLTVKSTIEQRGLAVISTSGALATLVLGLVSFAAARSPGPGAGIPVAAAYPRRYPEIPLSELRTMVDIPWWTEPDNTAAGRLTQARIEMLAKVRTLNGTKGNLLALSLAAEVLGVVTTGAAVLLLGTT